MRPTTVSFCLLYALGLGTVAHAQNVVTNHTYTPGPSASPPTVPVSIQSAKTVSQKDQAEAACFAFVAQKRGLSLTVDQAAAALPPQTDRPDQGIVPGWGMELTAFPALANKFGMTVVYRTGLSPAEATQLVQQGNAVVYRTIYFDFTGGVANPHPVPEASPEIVRKVSAYGNDKNGRAFTVVLLAVKPHVSVTLYDPYKGIVTLPADQVGSTAAIANAGIRRSCAYIFDRLLSKPLEAVVIAPGVSRVQSPSPQPKTSPTTPVTGASSTMSGPEKPAEPAPHSEKGGAAPLENGTGTGK